MSQRGEAGTPLISCRFAADPSRIDLRVPRWTEGLWMAVEPGLSSALEWRKSNASGGNQECVEVAKRGASILVRDSRNPSGAVLAFDPEQWGAFLSRIQGEDE